MLNLIYMMLSFWIYIRHSEGKVGDKEKISKYKNIFSKGCKPNWREEVLVTKNKIEILNRHKLLNILMEKKLQERFMK